MEISVSNNISVVRPRVAHSLPAPLRPLSSVESISQASLKPPNDSVVSNQAPVGDLGSLMKAICTARARTCLAC